MRTKTALIHGGKTTDPLTGAVTPAIYQTSTYKQDGIGNLRDGYEYSRTANPTRTALETLIADIEGGARGFAFASGMAAISTILMLMKSGDHVIVGSDVYGGTYRVFNRVFQSLGLEASFVDTSDAAAVREAVQPNTKMIYVETPTNPLLNVTDMRSVRDIATEADVLFVVDNTFMTPYFQNPIEFGADYVLHSATKYLGGHSDVVAGLVVARTEELGERLAFLQNSVGAVLGPQDSFLVVRGIKTLAVRMEEIETNALALVEFLTSHEAISRVLHPSIASETAKQIHLSQARGFGGMIAFDVGSAEAAETVVAKTNYFTLAESLGAVESLISVPARMTHASIPAERRAELGITDGLVRISVGLEDVNDLIEDLEQALAALTTITS
ncbi:MULTISPECIES: bifunctional cystathionine gamma-lyase/homocysteine desulfhydrase [unclassified Exiguobacterium]|uniref:bifunctional cystathionine gamma-lyase/homocysteine desulfhydrase n=1 Tax=unclassified Exiguobacterium TaxID=2644629 RepID=UPI00103F01A2|nr:MULTISPECIES: bifunctional cystathionine gamma-lyase/homocysteine desulfhydrase [unclassified Exiguobacterium]TCI39560.1 bifunctional cystathionine gamma-lyase/homocysteine desulfhydrase [Exiguobacterium sp. SH4S7]TCI47745.1 bifunctional cystathionine gamma-lyase/homocysteine desulfhydrase [Exiguobacterium sp. SH5S32]TCI54629.1 bifunctional cystathionine gamma-lyase/homocysteine desulfhydrase [Exiguobacterium sp. SH1S4]TCI61480.1 bifunctional cystathionine gamma-lyase/homocysteine desulfhydr